MTQTNDIISVQRLLLLTRGFTENTLHTGGEPRRFLSMLDHHLRFLDRKFPRTLAPQVFSRRLAANFENGRFPVDLDFNYKYHVPRHDLTIQSLKASLFDVDIVYPMEGKRNVELPTAGQILKELKSALLINIQKAVDHDKQKNPPRVRRHRVG